MGNIPFIDESSSCTRDHAVALHTSLCRWHCLLDPKSSAADLLNGLPQMEAELLSTRTTRMYGAFVQTESHLQ